MLNQSREGTDGGHRLPGRARGGAQPGDSRQQLQKLQKRQPRSRHQQPSPSQAVARPQQRGAAYSCSLLSAQARTRPLVRGGHQPPLPSMGPVGRLSSGHTGWMAQPPWSTSTPPTSCRADADRGSGALWAGRGHSRGTDSAKHASMIPGGPGLR